MEQTPEMKAKTRRVQKFIVEENVELVQRPSECSACGCYNNVDPGELW